MAAKVAFISRGSFLTEDENGRRFDIEKGTHSVPASVWERIKATLPIAVASQQLVELKPVQVRENATADEGDAPVATSTDDGGSDPVTSTDAAPPKPAKPAKAPKPKKPESA